MRVLMLEWFGSDANSGGMEVHIREICKNIASEKISITLAVPRDAKNVPAAKNIEIVEIPCSMRAKSIGEIIKNVSAFNKNITRAFEKRGFDFGIIHSHDWLCAESAKKLSEKYRVPWIHTVHSLEHIRAAEETDSKIARIEKCGILGADKIIAVSNLMKKEILKKYDVPAENMIVIRNSVSMDMADSKNETEKTNARRHKKNGITENETILFAGRLALQKGIETLIAAFPAVLQKHPRAKLIIAGGGNLKKSLIALARINGIEKSIIFSGRVSENELKQLYKTASLFVSPSVFEPFGITIIDAAEFGAPIIATKDTGALEIFGKNSVAVVEPQNPGALEKEIIALLDNSEKRANMSARAKNDLQHADNWKQIAEKTKEAYYGIIANSPNRKINN